MTTLSEYLEARAEVEAELQDQTQHVSVKNYVHVPVQALRTLLAGPPVNREDVARVMLSVAFERCQPSRGDVFGWLDDNTAPFADAIQALYRGETK